jgi:hypothetical protein
MVRYITLFALATCGVAIAQTSKPKTTKPPAPVANDTSFLKTCLDAGGKVVNEGGKMACVRQQPAPAVSPPLNTAKAPESKNDESDAGKFGVLEVTATDIRGCKSLGLVSGRSTVLVGITGGLGKKAARKSALKKAAAMNANRVVWSEMGGGMTNEYKGEAYRC